MMGALEFPQEARAAHRNRSRTTCAGLRYCGPGRTCTHTQRRRMIKPYAVAALLYILFARTYSTDTHAYARRQVLQRTVVRWERRNMLTHGSLIPHSISPHMYIMPDSRSSHVHHARLAVLAPCDLLRHQALPAVPVRLRHLLLEVYDRLRGVQALGAA